MYSRSLELRLGSTLKNGLCITSGGHVCVYMHSSRIIYQICEMIFHIACS